MKKSDSDALDLDIQNGIFNGKKKVDKKKALGEGNRTPESRSAKASQPRSLCIKLPQKPYFIKGNKNQNELILPNRQAQRSHQPALGSHKCLFYKRLNRSRLFADRV